MNYYKQRIIVLIKKYYKHKLCINQTLFHGSLQLNFVRLYQTMFDVFVIDDICCIINHKGLELTIPPPPPPLPPAIMSLSAFLFVGW